MDLKDILIILEDKKIHEPFLNWLYESKNNIEGKIITMNLIREIHLESWDNKDSFIKKIEEFSIFLSTHADYLDIAEFNNFFINNNFLFLGSYCENKFHVVHFTHAVHFANSLREKGIMIDIINSNYLNTNKKNNIIINNLKSNKIEISNKGITWLSIFNNELEKTNNPLDTCNILGKKDHHKNYFYFFLEPDENLNIQRPTIFDSFSIRFYPFKDKNGYGVTLSRLEMKKYIPEAISRGKSIKWKFKKSFIPSDKEMNFESSYLNTFLDEEIIKIQESEPLCYQNIQDAWYNTNIWWR